jgi:catechol 2,3-dioxygenase-like lactoylglutathione lyase family enzyme
VTCTITFYWKSRLKAVTLSADDREGLDRKVEWYRELGFRIVEARYEGTKQLSLTA